MKPGFSATTSSRYFHPAFNSAIFDGPFRIYFVQFHETFALKVYFYIQEEFKKNNPQYKERAREANKTILLMVYPTEDSFRRLFQEPSSTDETFLASAHFEREILFGLVATHIDSNIGQLMEELSGIFRTWESDGEFSQTVANTLIPWPDLGAAQ